MNPMIENEPKAVKRRVEALKEIYIYLTTNKKPEGEPIIWKDFTYKHGINTMFGQVLLKKGIIEEVKKEGNVRHYIWKVGEPNLQMVKRIMEIEREWIKKSKEKKSEPKLAIKRKQRIGVRFPIVFRSMFYIKEA